MSTRINNTHRYPVTPDRIMNMMKSREYFEEKYRAFGASDVVWIKFGDEGGHWVVGSSRKIPANLPDVAKKFVGDKTIVTQTEKWFPDGSGGFKCEFGFNLKGAPGGVTGWMKVVPVGAAESDWILEFDIVVPIPLLGKKLEGIVAEEMKGNISKEYKFNTDWLHSN
jgi:hypothetical protein